MRTIQVSDGGHVAILIFDEPVPADALVYSPISSRGDALSSTMPASRGVVPPGRARGRTDDTALLFSTVGTRLPDSRSRHQDAGGCVSSPPRRDGARRGDRQTEQKSDWSARDLSGHRSPMHSMMPSSPLIYGALSGEMRTKKLHGVDIVPAMRVRYSAAMARDMEHAGVGLTPPPMRRG